MESKKSKTVKVAQQGQCKLGVTGLYRNPRPCATAITSLNSLYLAHLTLVLSVNQPPFASWSTIYCQDLQIYGLLNV